MNQKGDSEMGHPFGLKVYANSDLSPVAYKIRNKPTISPFLDLAKVALRDCQFGPN